ncbi:RNA polymerase II C-terminal domain phosphatase-like [Melia azedarach]|uniref:RNA polymerase II C-terminal domain phosphatase-like n=1 Tax=Melia azedarach TaxID=155640 RepID=A0ACC1YDP0_MELAZ|nr:RNA polymerase II C-terminal domain phosphatase-like [Melia azedarach]
MECSVNLRSFDAAALMSRSMSHSGSVSAKEQICTHFTVLDGICVACNKDIGDFSSVTFDYLFNSDPIRHTETLLRNRKLVLVLDLDHTLLHTCKLKDLTSEEKYLKEKVDSLENISNRSLFRWEEAGFLVKLRPYVRNFLEEASNMFEMYICTMGSQIYAEKIAELIDADCKYFDYSRIIACEEFKQYGKKDLSLVLGEESSIVILDDTESVWSDHAKNLITVSSYDYFKQREFEKSYSEEKTDESESDGALANILRVLKTVHGLFFENPACGDVPSLLAKIRGGILTGCTLLFQDFPLTRSRAELMGATCTAVMDSSVTHVVVSSNTKTEELCRWAEQEKKFLVNPWWIMDAYFLWHRQPEEDYFP